MTSKIIKIAILILFLVLISYLNHNFSSSKKGEIIIFWGQGCPHCMNVENFIQQNNLDKYFNIERREIYFNKENREKFNKICQELNIPMEKQGVPLAVIDKEYYVGDKEIIRMLSEKKSYKTTSTNSSKTSSTSKNLNQANVKSQSLSNLPANNKRLTLTLVLGAAFVDAINPCAFAVLIILMATILNTQNRIRALIVGLSFSAAIYISYLAMGLGIYRALATAKFSIWFIKSIGILAIIIGLFNIKDFFWYGGGGFLMEVPKSWRPKMKSFIRSITSPFGAFIIGILVSLFLLPCTSGPYIVILGMLSQKQTFLSALGWLLLYNAVFILPMIVITLLCYLGLKPEKLENLRQKKLQLLHLIAGLIMVAMGIAILVNLV